MSGITRAFLYGSSVLGTALACYFAWEKPEPFRFHPMAMAFAFQLLGTAGIDLVRRRKIILASAKNKDPSASKKATDLKCVKLLMQLHVYCNALSVFVLTTFGWWCIYTTKEDLEKEHLTSWHSWAGIAAIIGTLGVGVGGVMLNNRLYPRGMYKALSTVHAYAGYILYLIGLIAILIISLQWSSLSEIESRVYAATVVTTIVASIIDGKSVP